MKTMKTQSEKAELLRSLHHGPDILVLPNAWDCASARIFDQAGFPAIATTSAGLANSLGYPDGQRIPREEMLAAVKRIAGCVDVPVTADLEAGYEDTAKTTAGLVDSDASTRIYPLNERLYRGECNLRLDNAGIRLIIRLCLSIP